MTRLRPFGKLRASARQADRRCLDYYLLWFFLIAFSLIGYEKGDALLPGNKFEILNPNFETIYKP